MAIEGRFIIQIGKLKNAPENIDVIALPFTDCPSGMLEKGSIVYIPFYPKSGKFEIELVINGPKIFMRGWDVLCELNEIEDLQKLFEHLCDETRGRIVGRRLYALHSFSMKASPSQYDH